MEEKDQREIMNLLSRGAGGESDILEEERIKTDTLKLKEFLNG